ncbi:MAG: undecaprenyl/decaprenyl-phosphate alpha-N-acetylglucosaminyl 1-phosphate transferase [Coriobacteriales bacterium]|nr:undecaprenyl/decaprenyl-phosphate alpha-N-acetylglucosaminyl 1-phosphate transferase [Coriobacteriales bacterium]
MRDDPMPFDLIHIIILGGVALITTLALVPLSKWASAKLNAVDYPSDRRINAYPVPRLGGLALFGGLLVAMVFEYVGETVFGWQGFFQDSSPHGINFPLMLCGVACMVLVGAIDDVRKLHPGFKFAGQILAALIIAFSGVQLSEIRNPLGNTLIDFGWFAYPLTILYLVAFANIINLIDGLDGLASGVVGIAALGLLVIAFAKGRIEVAVLAIILVGICLGFLRYNYHPASVYMGDSGALMLGTLLGIISLVGVMRSPTFIALIVPIVLAGIPVVDTFLAIVRRIRRRKPVYQFDLDHLHHTLLKRGFHPQQIVLILYAWTALLTVGGIAISNTYGITVYVLFALLAVVSIALIVVLGLYDPVLRHFYNPRRKGAGEPTPDETSRDSTNDRDDA